jgi:hypothetical protein
MHPEEIHRLGHSVRRTFFSALLDRTVTQEELRHELLSLIQGWPATVGKQAPAEHLKVITDAPRRTARDSGPQVTSRLYSRPVPRRRLSPLQ